MLAWPTWSLQNKWWNTTNLSLNALRQSYNVNDLLSGSRWEFKLSCWRTWESTGSVNRTAIVSPLLNSTSPSVEMRQPRQCTWNIQREQWSPWKHAHMKTVPLKSQQLSKRRPRGCIFQISCSNFRRRAGQSEAQGMKPNGHVTSYRETR